MVAIETQKNLLLKQLKSDEIKNFHLATHQVPTFNGDPKRWPNFKETFDTLVIKNDLRAVECLFHLQEPLTGPDDTTI